MPSDTEIETFLRRFKPSAPGPLAKPRPAHPWLVLAAVAAAAVAIVSLAWRLGLPPSRSSGERTVAQSQLEPTVGILNAALRAGNLDSVLDEMERRTMPDPRRQGGALEVLARDDACSRERIGGRK